MSTKSWFATQIYYAPLQRGKTEQFNNELLKEAYQLRDFDRRGRKWSETNYLGGYTSYGSMSELHKFSSTFARLEQLITPHVKRFARELEMDLSGSSIAMTDCWVNIMPAQTVHSLHIHPLSFISGTYYVATPKDCAGIRFEDPRLDRFMKAPPKKNNCSERNQPFVNYKVSAGKVVLFESWLRHEVPASRNKEDRVSISFNYNWF